MIDDKELIELAQASDIDDPLRDIDRNVAQFIIDTGMVEDPNGCVNFKHIYWTYVKWAQFHDLPILYNNFFGAELRKKFKSRKIGAIYTRDTYVYVNKEPYEVDDKEIWTMRAYYRKRRKRNGNKEKIKS
jgi:hypothetical protein